MKLIKRDDPTETGTVPGAIDRRTFLRRSGLSIGGLSAAAALPLSMIQRQATAATGAQSEGQSKTEIKRTVCTHCAVGCGIYAEVENGVWTGQEPALDHPVNRGAHCAKGAAIRELGHGERRLKYPTKLVNGQWQRVSWQQAIDEIGDQLLQIRDKSGPDSMIWLGSAKFSNEEAYLYRKFAALWGSNNVDHQARICHSTTVAGVANTWGYGAMTNSFNDIHNAQAIMVVGGNPAEAHPVSMRHIFAAKERNRAPLIVLDPRFTRTAAHADLHLRLRPGTDVPVIWGMLWHVFENGWEDKEFIHQRVYGMDEVRAEVARWTPEEVERVSGVKPELVKRAAELMAKRRPSTLTWAMGITQHTVGNSNTRAYSIFQLALGNIGVAGGGALPLRGHDNVQGATDMGVLNDTLPGYYGLTEGAWRHWAAVWDLDYEWLAQHFDQGSYGELKPMNTPGIPLSRWIDGVLEDPANIAQKDSIKAMVFWGQSPNTQTRGLEMRDAMNRLDLLVVVDPHPTVSAVMHERTDGVYLLPATTKFETSGSVSASNRSVQWREKVIEPLFESLPDHTIMYKFARKLGFADELCKHIEVNDEEPLVEDITREFNRGMWTIGYTGHSPERLKLHQQNWHTFDYTSLEAKEGPCKGEYYGLPWPCWGTPEQGHPGSPNLYDTSKPVARGGLPFRARFGIERQGVSLLAEDSFTVGSEIEDGYPEFSAELLKRLGWWDELTEQEKQAADGKNWKTDLSGGIQRVAIKHGCAPYGNAKARAVVWTFPDPVPIHREPLFTTRRDLVEQYPTYADRKEFFRLPTRYASIQAKDYSQDYPLILTSGRLVEYEGGGDETRSNPWLAELQQHMFAEINIVDAEAARIKDGDDMWVHGPEGSKIRVRAKVTTNGVTPGLVWLPYHFGGHFQGEDLGDKYPEGTAPFVLGEAANTVFPYGYDSVTQIQETKCGLCRVERA